jgi:hypothetical protein
MDVNELAAVGPMLSPRDFVAWVPGGCLTLGEIVELAVGDRKATDDQKANP